jgi:quercetin dioxygenase-like cupin family protein
MIHIISPWLLAIHIFFYFSVGFGFFLPTGGLLTSAETKPLPPALSDDAASSASGPGHAKVQRQSKSNLPGFREFITTHDPKTGEAIFSQIFPGDIPSPAPDDSKFTPLYSSDGFPIDMANATDIDLYDTNRKRKMALVNPRGSVIRYIDFEPGNSGPILMHRTISLDYGILMEGELELILGSGEKRTIKRGDVVIQRGTKHAWRNPSPNNWARMLFIMQASKPIVVNGVTLGEEYKYIPS